MMDEGDPTALFVIHDLRPGGAERVFLHYVTHLRGVRVVPVLVRPYGEWMSRLPSATRLYHLEAGGIPAMAAAQLPPWPEDVPPDRESWWAGATALVRKANRLARIAEREGARIVSTFLHKSHAIALTTRSLFSPDLRVVVNVHEQPLRHVETHFSRWRRPWARLLAGRGLSSANRVVAVAPGIARELESVGAYAPGRLAVAPNPVDVAAIRRGAGIGVPDGGLPAGDGPLVVGVGRLERIKGFDLLIEALAAGHPSWRLVVVGDGPEAGALRARARGRGLEERVRFVGYQENPYPWIEAADLLALPSRTDAWPNVIGEAFALGTPVVATRCSASVTELLGAGERGLLVEAADARALRAGIASALEDGGATPARSAAARVWVERHTPTAASRHYAALLRGVPT
jgi:glycosyltransferase involved in cell wall biosynthesis